MKTGQNSNPSDCYHDFHQFGNFPFFPWNPYLKTNSISLRFLIFIKDPKQDFIKILLTKGQLLKGDFQ
jgi:hypothetical protein